jgi:PAB1-binding protein PBP1
MPWYDVIWNPEPGGNTDYQRWFDMANEIRERILRPATPEEKERHLRVRQQIQEEMPEIKEWAQVAAARQKDRIAVGTVFSHEEAGILEAIDAYAAKNALQNRGAVVRAALSQLLGIEIAR